MGVFSHNPMGPGLFQYPYGIDQSCRFNDDDSAKLTRAMGAVTNRKIYTLSTWIKRTGLPANNIYLMGVNVLSTDRDGIYINNNGWMEWFELLSGGYEMQIKTNNLLRDHSAWYHIVAAYDNTQATAADRAHLYINGVEASYLVANYPTQNRVPTYLNGGTGVTQTVGSNGLDANEHLDGYMAETHMIDGQQLTPSDFGETNNGIWVPKRYTGTYGNEGWHLDHSNASNFGEDQSGNNNDFTDSGLATNDQMEDTPTNNYCTLNLLDVTNDLGTGGVLNLSNGNLDSDTTSTTQMGAAGTITVTQGKWYFEGLATGTPDSGLDTGIGIVDVDLHNVIYYQTSGDVYDGDSRQAYGATFTNGDIIGVALDMDAQTVEFFKNNVSQGVVNSDITLSVVTAWVRAFDAAGVAGWDMNFGQLGFTYTPPSGFEAINSDNLEPLSPPFNVFSNCTTDDEYSSGTYTGNGSADGPFVYCGFRPTNVCIDNTDYDGSGGIIDILSNGFKLRHAATKNVSPTVYSWEAWLDQDFKYANAAPN